MDFLKQSVNPQEAQMSVHQKIKRKLFLLCTNKKGSIKSVLLKNKPSLLMDIEAAFYDFDTVKQRATGDIQGFIVVETEKITKPGGSINLFVKKTR